MCSILLPVDGSENSDRATRFLIGPYAKLAPANVYLLHVQAPMVSDGDKFVSRESIDQKLATTGEEALQSARTLLADARIPYTSEVERGYVASSVVEYAKGRHCAGIVMGTRGMGSTEDLLGSIARQVVYLADVPVTLVK